MFVVHLITLPPKTRAIMSTLKSWALELYGGVCYLSMHGFLGVHVVQGNGPSGGPDSQTRARQSNDDMQGQPREQQSYGGGGGGGGRGGRGDYQY